MCGGEGNATEANEDDLKPWDVLVDWGGVLYVTSFR